MSAENSAGSNDTGSSPVGRSDPEVPVVAAAGLDAVGVGSGAGAEQPVTAMATIAASRPVERVQVFMGDLSWVAADRGSTCLDPR
jgi:hypothetical protein